MSKIKQKAKHTTDNRIIYIYICKLGENENNSPVKAGVYRHTPHPNRAKSVSVCPNSELF